jgi:hypothetical protein
LSPCYHLGLVESVDVTDARSQPCELTAHFESNAPVGTGHDGQTVRRHACIGREQVTMTLPDKSPA